MSESSFEARLDQLTTDLLTPLRSAGRAKQLPAAPLAEVISLVGDLSRNWANAEAVPRIMVGKLWFIFTTMLAEVDHADEPEPILDAAWAYADALRQVFGPTF